MKKYEFTGETKKTGISGDITVRRIRAVVSFGEIKAGEIGGWIEKEENLSQEGGAWICGDAEAYANARVFGNAEIRDNARVYGYAEICDNAEIFGNARVYGDAKVYDYAQIHGNAEICENAKVYGDAEIFGNAEVCGNAEILQTNHLLVIGPIGSRSTFTTFFRDKDNEISVRCGCFLGKVNRFLEKVQQTHGESRYALVYRAAAEVAKIEIDLEWEESVEHKNQCLKE